MKNMKSLTLVAVLLFMNPVFAQESATQESKVITEFHVKQAISLLIKAGVLAVENSELVVKTPSILEQLNQQGHVDTGHASPNAICAKGE